MTKLEYLKYSIKNGYLGDLTWYYTFMVILVKDIYKNEYIEVANKKMYVYIDGEKVELENSKFGEPVYRITDVYDLDKNDMDNLDKKITTTIGYIVLNYVLVSSVFGNKITYIEDFDIKKLEKRLAKMLIEDKITVKDFKKWMNHCIFMESMSRITTVSATEKNMTIPKGLMEYKKKLSDEYDKKYGKDVWREDQVKISEFENKLRDYYEEWVKDDPSNNIFLAGKIKGNSVMLRYLTVGTPARLGVSGERTKHVKNSLTEGLPEDTKELASMFNVPISASYARGKSTAEGGTVSKQLLRSTSSVKITKNDCKVTYGMVLTVTEDNMSSMVHRYMIVNKKSILIDEDMIKKYIGKEIEIRSPIYCKEKETNFCSVCVGEMLKKYENSASLLVTDVSSVLLTSSLKKMHNSKINVMKTDIHDMFMS